MTLLHTSPTVGDMLRRWRRLRGMSQRDFACEAGISQRLGCL
jgi:transcriptional regulator with XRE-family HTH domain